eukprot:5099187-Alexandrium_andersonii.AAC.1
MADAVAKFQTMQRGPSPNTINSRSEVAVGGVAPRPQAEGQGGTAASSGCEMAVGARRILRVGDSGWCPSSPELEAESVR